jgi:hypothetical protein
LSGAVLGPILGKDGKPLLEDADRDSEGMILIDGNTEAGTAYVSFERNHRIPALPVHRRELLAAGRNGAPAA